MQRSALFGGGPEIHFNRIENLWAHRIIYTHHWRALLKDLSDEWIAAAAAVSGWLVEQKNQLNLNYTSGRTDVGVSE